MSTTHMASPTTPNLIYKFHPVFLNMATGIYVSSILLALLNRGASDINTSTVLSFPFFFIILINIIFTDMPKSAINTIYLVFCLIFVVFTCLIFQSASFLPEMITHPAWDDVLGITSVMNRTISVTVADDWAALSRITVPLGVFVCGLLLFRSDERAMLALKMIAFIGGLISIGSILQFMLAPHTLLLGIKIAYLDSLTAPFVNRNTAATFFGLVLLIEWALIQREFQKIDLVGVLLRLHSGRRSDSITIKQLHIVGLYTALLLSSLVALMLTKSRAGIGSSFIALIILVVLFAGNRNKRLPRTTSRPSRYRRWLFAILIGLSVFSLSGRVLLRAEVQGVADARFCVLPGIWDAISDRFPFGSGLSSFQEVFPAYRDAGCGIGRVWDKAHNVYLEGMVSLGAFFVVMVVIVVIWLSCIFVLGLKRRRRMRMGAEIGLASLSLIAIHSAFDFSLQISGLAMVVAAIFAPAATLSLRSPAKSGVF
ncbi:O-antigen ligase family protein [Rhizobium sp. XQZ8]|uniref:O-antigen ligase family protein n=1 Tax=Rhizobium populisoli TaxID=2859785 RepID=UPI001CA5A177|nr:O-antigen ligase family protein [Rhizobium populisoli]MBW6426039.1 O-antigen ligase family protein [Rhizobium populisoli]